VAFDETGTTRSPDSDSPIAHRIGGEGLSNGPSTHNVEFSIPTLSMHAINFEEVLDRILAKDSRYHREAYLFVREGLDYTQKKISRNNKNELRHITGQELSDGLREYGLFQYGPLTAMVLEEWGVHNCEDFGEIVFNMVENGLLSKTETDSREDFKACYDFTDAFCKPFRPSSQWPVNPIPERGGSDT
jgi:uncharacterized repeat protein (TIGR04138 family)